MTTTRGFWFGTWNEDPTLRAADVPLLLSQAQTRSREAREVTLDVMLPALRELQRRFATGGPGRELLLETKAEATLGLSRPMLQWGLDVFCARLDPDHVRQRLAAQGVTHETTRQGRSRLWQEPLGVVGAIVAGNVFFGPAEALVAGLLTRNVVIVKASSGCEPFLSTFVGALQEVAPTLARCVAVVSWRGGERELESALVRGVDGLLLAAGPETIAAYRAMALPTTTLIEHGPRLSLAVITAGGVAELDADGLARDVALWDQAACTSAQCVLVEGVEASEGVAARLAQSLARLAEELPEGPTTLDQKIEVARWRAAAQFASALGEAHITDGRARGALWTVVWEPATGLSPTPLHRCVRVRPYQQLEDVLDATAAAHGAVQTIGLACSQSERQEIERRLAGAGARRICPIGQMSVPDPIAPRDGALDLMPLVRWVSAEEVP